MKLNLLAALSILPWDLYFFGWKKNFFDLKSVLACVDGDLAQETLGN